jgi:hypothetical protein
MLRPEIRGRGNNANDHDMREAALKADQKFSPMQDRAYSNLAMIIQGLIRHCGVPQDAITLLKWNEEQTELLSCG